MKSIRVLIVDDSPVFRSVLHQLLSSYEDIEIVGMASDPLEAKDLIIAHQPDVITLDVEMPRMDGITFLKRLMRQRPTPVVMISSYTRKNSLRTLEALDAGAVDFVAKPPPETSLDLEEFGHEVMMKLKAAVQVRMRPMVARPPEPRVVPLAPAGIHKEVIAIGASTGGPKAIQAILRALPPRVCGIVIAQHMAARFTEVFAKRLDASLPLTVGEAQTGDRVEHGRVLVAPGGKHMQLQRDAKGYRVRIFDGPAIKNQKPSIDVLFRSVADSAGPHAVGVLLTGMGDDGSEGLLAMKQAGATTIVQDETSSAVFGMPKAAMALGAADSVASLQDIPGVILASLTTES